MSLRRRILWMLLLIIALTVSLSVGAGYYSAHRQFQAFVDELSRSEAENLAAQLSRAYTEVSSWETLNFALADAGYDYDSETEHQEGAGGEQDEEAPDSFHVDRIRVVVTDVAGRIVHDNLSELEIGRILPVLSGQRTDIQNLRTGQTVGFAFVDVDQNFLASESQGFLRHLILSSIIGGLLTAVLAILLANSLSKRITEPVTALTQATQAIAQRDEPTLLPVVADDELGQMSAAFNQMTSALQKQRNMRKQLIDDLSHELNTPLTVIQLEAKGLLDELQKPEQAARQIIQELCRLRNLVSDLNWLAETDSGRLKLNIERCALDKLLIREVERWQPQANANNTELTLQPVPPMPALEIDPLRVHQALGNIIHNALKHSAGGRVLVAGAIEDAQVQVAVIDDGEGIAENDLPHVFGRFYRAYHSQARNAAGAGLGLDIARAIIEAHGGAIAVNSEGISRGTTVKVTLPVAPSIDRN